MTKDVKFKDEKGNWKDGIRCGAPRRRATGATKHAHDHNQDPDHHHHGNPFDRRELQDAIETGHVNGRKLSGGEINTVIHVICNDNGSGCKATQQMVDEQMNVMNAAYSGTGLSFNLLETKYKNYSAWTSVGYGSTEEFNMKNTLAVDPATTFNVYITDLTGGLLGWATFPDMYAEGDKMHGVVNLAQSLPGGSASPYNLGDTLVHEAGHYLGLYHTFQDGCTGGDQVSDTPAEASPAYGCDVGRDTCSGGGLDPINNFVRMIFHLVFWSSYFTSHAQLVSFSYTDGLLG